VDLVLRGRALLNRTPSAEALAEARRLFERAVELDPDSADAHARLAQAHINAIRLGVGDREANLAAAEEHAARALAIAPRHTWAHLVRANVLRRRWRFEEALAELDALIAAGSLTGAYAERGWVKALTGRPAEAFPDLAQAIRLSPRDQQIGGWHEALGVASLMLGRDEEAAAHFGRARVADPNQPRFILQLASAYALTGRTVQGRAALGEFRRLRPNDTIGGWRRGFEALSDHPLYRATRERQLAALRAIGMPEE
jgi:tetratricopeptide (TPR) repeat protein